MDLSVKCQGKTRGWNCELAGRYFGDVATASHLSFSGDIAGSARGDGNGMETK